MCELTGNRVVNAPKIALWFEENTFCQGRDEWPETEAHVDNSGCMNSGYKRRFNDNPSYYTVPRCCRTPVSYHSSHCDGTVHCWGLDAEMIFVSERMCTLKRKDS